jgi:hypothetical protein
MTSFGRRLEGICCGAVVVTLGSLALASCEWVETKEERLVKAARGGDVVAVERLLAEGADPNRKDANGVTPLLIAAERGDAASVAALIKRGAAVNAADIHGQTPLMLSAWSFRPAVVIALLRHGADPCLKSGDGRTALVGSLLRSDQLNPSAEQQREVIEVLRAIDCDNKRAAARTPAAPAAIVSPANATGEPQRLAFIVGYLDLFGNVMNDRGGSATGNRLVERAEMMRNVARSRSASQEEFRRNVDEGIRRAMNDYNSLDGRLLAIRVIEYENEGLLLWLKLIEQSNAAATPDPSEKTPSSAPYTSAEASAEPPAADGSTPAIVEQWQAFVQQLPQDSASAAESINNAYATSGIPFSYWVVRNADPSTLTGLNLQPHPCGRTAVLTSPTIPPPDNRIDSDRVFEVDKAGRTIQSWQVPVDRTPEGLEGDELLIPSHAGNRKDFVIAVKPDGRYHARAAPADRRTPARVMCPPHGLFQGSAYAQCVLVPADGSAQTVRYLVYEAPCS